MHLKATLDLELLRLGLSQRHLTTGLSNTFLPPCGLRNPVLAGEGRMGMLWLTAITSPPSGHTARAGTGRSAGNRQECRDSSHKLLLMDPSVPAVTELWLQLLQMLEKSTRDTCDFKKATGLKIKKTHDKLFEEVSGQLWERTHFSHAGSWKKAKPHQN